MMKLDLNLLQTFDALMEHRSVTRAAASLSITQSAVSHALARLRSALDDPLFVRGGGVLQPTATAEAIAGGIRRGLGEFEQALSGTQFDPARAERVFTLAASAYFCVDLVPALVAALRHAAPGVSLRLIPVTDMLMPMLDRGEVDLALGAAIETPARFVVEPLYAERFVWIAAQDHPLTRGTPGVGELERADRVSVVTSGPFSAASHAINAPSAPPSSDLPDREAAPAAASGITVYDSQTAVAIVARSDLIARIPERTAVQAAKRDGIAILETAAEEPRARIAMMWHARRRSAQDLAWLRDRVRQVAG